MPVESRGPKKGSHTGVTATVALTTSRMYPSSVVNGGKRPESPPTHRHGEVDVATVFCPVCEPAAPGRPPSHSPAAPPSRPGPTKCKLRLLPLLLAAALPHALRTRAAFVTRSRAVERVGGWTRGRAEPEQGQAFISFAQSSKSTQPSVRGPARASAR